MPADHHHLVIRRGVFVGINLCVFVAIYILGLRPIILLLSDQADRLAQARATLARYRAIAVQETTVRSSAADAWNSASSVAFLQGASDGAINASLQAHLKSVAAQAGSLVHSVHALEPLTDRNIRFLGAHLELAGTIGAIHATLQRIEDREPYLFVDTATLRMPAIPTGVSSAQEPSIEAQFDVYGPVRSHAAVH